MLLACRAVRWDAIREVDKNELPFISWQIVWRDAPLHVTLSVVSRSTWMRFYNCRLSKLTVCPYLLKQLLSARRAEQLLEHSLPTGFPPLGVS